MSNMRHLVEFEDQEIEEELEEIAGQYEEEFDAKDEEEKIIEQHRASFIKPIQDKIDREKEAAMMQELAEKAKQKRKQRDSLTKASFRQPDLEGIDEADDSPLGVATLPINSSISPPKSNSSPHNSSNSGGGSPRNHPPVGSMHTSGSMRKASTMSTNSRHGSRREIGGYNNSEIVSMQIATLQERTDKVYAMLTTKLGRVR